MHPKAWLLALRLSALVALGVSAALFVDYAGTSTYCASGSGCATVRTSGFGFISFGERTLPVPALGLLGFSALLALSLVDKRPALNLLKLGGLLGGVTSLVLVWLQTRIGQFCAYCVVVDVAALVAALSVTQLRLKEPAKAEAAKDTRGKRRKERAQPAEGDAPGFELEPWAWVALGVLAVGLPIVWPTLKPAPPVPAAIRAHYASGKISVVEFADFECPHCRRLHGRLKAIMADYGDAVHFVRLNMPLSMHPNAENAARAAICAETQGRAEVMADALFETESLTPQGIRALAERLGLDLAKFDRCLTDEATAARVAREGKILRDAGFKGLPTTFVGGSEIVGAQSEETFRDAFERAKRGDEDVGMPAPLFVGLGILGVAAVVRFGRRKTLSPTPSKQPVKAT